MTPIKAVPKKKKPWNVGLVGFVIDPINQTLTCLQDPMSDHDGTDKVGEDSNAGGTRGS